MKLSLLAFGIFLSLQIFAAPEIIQREIKVLSGGTKILGPNPNWSVKDSKVGVACSRLHGFINPENNEIMAACKVCYTDKFNYSNWQRVKPLTEGESFKVTFMIVGEGVISENYHCELNNKNEHVCRGDSFRAIATSQSSDKKISIECSSKTKLERADLNEIFKGSLDFREDFVYED